MHTTRVAAPWRVRYRYKIQHTDRTKIDVRKTVASMKCPTHKARMFWLESTKDLVNLGAIHTPLKVHKKESHGIRMPRISRRVKPESSPRSESRRALGRERQRAW